MERSFTKRFNAFDLIILALVGVNAYNFVNDIDYWRDAPVPFYVFIWTQLLSMLTLIRVPCTKFSSRCKDLTIMYCVFFIVANTITGTYEFVKLYKDHEDFLKTFYYVEGMILLGIPLAIATFFVIAIIVAIIFV